MNNLPVELLPFIFKHLPILDLIKLRRISKKFYFEIDRLKIEELIIIIKGSNSSYKWFCTNKKLNQLDTIKLDSNAESIFRSYLINLNLLRNLKGLIIDFPLNSKYFAYITQFTKLEQLNIHSSVDVGGVLFHPNLKILYINGNCFYYEYDDRLDDEYFGHWRGNYHEAIDFPLMNYQQFEIDCKNLECVFIGGFGEFIDIIHKEKINWLFRSLKNHEYYFEYMIRIFNESDEIYKYNYEQFKEFINLECFICDHLDNLLEENIIDKLIKLKKLVIKYDEKEDKIPVLKNSLINLFKLERVKMNEIEIYIDKQKLTNPNELDSLLSNENIENESQKKRQKIKDRR